MKTQRIIGTDLEVSRVALGCMRMPEPAQAIAAARAAVDAGINFFDHANIYGRGRCETAFASVWREMPGLRGKVIIQSKVGIRHAGDPNSGSPGRYDFSYEHIKESVDASLKRLDVDHLDILLLHRPDALVEPEEVARAFDEIEQAGKVRYFGVSNHAGWQIDLLKKHVRQPLVVNQLEFSLLHMPLINAGSIVNQDTANYPTRGDGALDYCRLHDITVQAWSPLAHGIFGGSPADERAQKAIAAVATMAAAKGVAPETILIAWLLRHPAKIQPIVGSTNPSRIAAAARATEVELSREEWYTLFVAARDANMP